MDDFDELLRRGVAGYDPAPELGRAGVDRRLRRRHRNRRIGAAAVSLTMFSATLGAALFVVAGRQVNRIPVAAPSPTPSPHPEVPLGMGSRWCREPNVRIIGGGNRRAPDYCIDQMSETVRVADGGTDGSAWSMDAFRARYRGTVGANGDERTLSMLCHVWRYDGFPTGMCTAAVGGEGMYSIEGFVYSRHAWAPAINPTEVEPPLEGFEHGGFTGHMAGEHQAMWFLTEPETARVKVVLDGEETREARLFGPFEALGTDRKWVLVFLPRLDQLQTVDYTAYDADGNVLWTEHDRYDERPEPAPTP